MVEGDMKAPFSIATTLKCWGRCNSFSLITPLIFDPYLIILNVKQVLFFWVFGMTWPGIEPQFPRPLVNTLTIMPMGRLFIYIYIYIYIVILRQTVSLYHNSSVWLDMPDTWSWDWNPPNFMLNLVSYHSY